MVRRIATIILALVFAGSAARAEIIDRILSVVEGQLITLSDVRAVTRLGLETVTPSGDPVGHVLEKLIDRQLMLVEVERYAPPEPRAETIEARLASVRAKFPDALAVEAVLHQTGMTADDLRRYLRDSLRIESYLEQRFTASIQPSDEEVAAYYRLHELEFTRGGVLVPYTEAQNDARARLIAERRAALVRDWLTGLRRRAIVVQLYLTPSATAPR
jgi:hypothetical protein